MLFLGYNYITITCDFRLQERLKDILSNIYNNLTDHIFYTMPITQKMVKTRLSKLKRKNAVGSFGSCRELLMNHSSIMSL